VCDVRIGVSLRTAFAPRDVRTTARWLIERAAAARDARLDSLFVGDHHATGAAYFQNVPTLGRLLAEWDDKPAGALFLLPLWNPVLVAEQVGALAAIARGRFILQCAIGADENQFRAMGADIRKRPSAFESSLVTIRRLLAGEAVDGARIGPLPPEPVEVWIGASAPRAIDRAARMGDAWLAGPEATPAQARRMLELYRDRCSTHGRTPAAIAIRRDVHVGADDADADRVAGPVLARGYRGFGTEPLVVGGPEHVAEKFAELASMGYTDVLVRHLADDQEEVLASFGRLAAVRSDVLNL
jgi:alkanesulfonate monooxygenase SsuD/methylene tetrahydromethanopterin reductase-like flavin-dependent oxidoreductase (luciferase family)